MTWLQPDLLSATAALVDISSVSHHETELADHVETRLRAIAWLTIDRVGDNIVARSMLGRPMRLILAGHLDTVPANGNATARRDGDVLHGLGSADMKGGLAVFLYLAETLSPDELAHDVTFVFYVCEEVAAVHNGLKALFELRPELLGGDAAILGEPTQAGIEAGCQGTLRAELILRGARAHTARPWMGRNAIHRLGIVLERLHTYEGRRPVISGCEFREALQAVKVEGGIAGNVVPDSVLLLINHRFAPDRTGAEATEHVRQIIGEDILTDEADFRIVDLAEGALPGMDHPLLARLGKVAVGPARAKLGWTDVAFFSAHSIPAVNFGPGDPTIAHTAGEHVYRHEVDAAAQALTGVLLGST